jgi:hypothetical protein
LSLILSSLKVSMSWILYVEVLKEMVMAQTKFGWWEFLSCYLEIIGLMNSGKFNMVSTQDINVDHGIE